jgi:diguanylate cyclase (GGDEF)-like protein/PAS domain S-box-containing protein
VEILIAEDETIIARDIAQKIAVYKHALERKLRTSEQRFFTTLKSIGDGVVVADTAGRVTFVNDVAARLTGLTSEQATGMAFDQVFTLIDAVSRAPLVFERALAVSEREPTRTSVLVGRDGREWPIDDRASLIRDEDGGVTGVVVIFREVSERRAAEDALRRANAQLSAAVRRLERQTYEIGMLSMLSNDMQRCETLGEAYAAISAAARRLFAEDDGALYIRRDGLTVETITCWGQSCDALALPTPECWTARASLLPLTLHSGATLEAAAVPHTTCAPLATQGFVFGVLHIRTKAAPGTNGEQSAQRSARERLIAALAEQAALGLANVRLRETLREQATRDPLTGLFNRRYMEETLERELHRAARNQHSVGVIMLDIDHFKRVNDTYGHNGGDAVLRAVGMVLAASVRTEDVVCRYGGEEFVLVMPGVPRSVVIARAEQIRAAIRELRVPHECHEIGPLTVSAGVTVVTSPQISVAVAIQRADSALYQAKKTGRDQVVAV